MSNLSKVCYKIGSILTGSSNIFLCWKMNILVTKIVFSKFTFHFSNKLCVRLAEHDAETQTAKDTIL